MTVGEGTVASSEIDVELSDPSTTVSIGKYTAIGRNLKLICSSGHDPSRVCNVNLYDAQEDPIPRSSVRSLGPISIGHDVWIGDDVTIMGGTSIGNGAVVGTKSLVTSSLEPYGIYGGVPVRLIRFRFSPEIRTELERLAWWDLPPAVLRELRGQLMVAEAEEAIRILQRAKLRSASGRVSPS
ncbi:MAG: CatB-related O-acetyltransferase [Euryarchaeota archaeon]|nr:CatB-related O-acetyltransferase [Euryarchaeota archaeon]MDE1837259.1 CatB-related O-acetyltransferase [Euryarchaeota archaeon]MDE1879929.1 CatB-related O-acetyltransferase [Euryarchaeota archaeon]MDE2045137.1 CatB-related O-acetyltransferase [Thermoplasmata archaeon]